MTILSGANALLTQAVKKLMDDARKDYSSNFAALVDAVVCGFGGTMVYYVISGSRIDGTEILMAVLMTVSVWVGSMVGYDKIMQLIRQIGEAGNGRD